MLIFHLSTVNSAGHADGKLYPFNDWHAMANRARAMSELVVVSGSDFMVRKMTRQSHTRLLFGAARPGIEERYHVVGLRQLRFTCARRWSVPDVRSGPRGEGARVQVSFIPDANLRTFSDTLLTWNPVVCTSFSRSQIAREAKENHT
jgi:hypothetical protein